MSKILFIFQDNHERVHQKIRHYARVRLQIKLIKYSKSFKNIMNKKIVINNNTTLLLIIIILNGCVFDVISRLEIRCGKNEEKKHKVVANVTSKSCCVLPN